MITLAALTEQQCQMFYSRLEKQLRESLLFALSKVIPR